MKMLARSKYHEIKNRCNDVMGSLTVAAVALISARVTVPGLFQCSRTLTVSQPLRIKRKI